jgi:hypothetical protein
LKKGTKLCLAADVSRRWYSSEVELLDYDAFVELLFREDQAVIDL